MSSETDSRPTAYAKFDAPKDRILELAQQLDVNVEFDEPLDEGESMLFLSETGLSLFYGGLTLQGDFVKLLPRLRTNVLNAELLVRAARLKDMSGAPRAIDATAGLGEDALLLAAAGFTVELYERNPVTAALLRDTLRRAAQTPALAQTVARMSFAGFDSIEALLETELSPDVVYLDPMFPLRRKSGLIKKKFQVMHDVECPCSDEQELMRAALAAHPKKIVVKRPIKGAYLASVKPSYSITGGVIRYDCILPPETAR